MRNNLNVWLKKFSYDRFLSNHKNHVQEYSIWENVHAILLSVKSKFSFYKFYFFLPQDTCLEFVYLCIFCDCFTNCFLRMYVHKKASREMHQMAFFSGR